MNTNELKTAFAKERHAEFMIASGGAILVAVIASVLDPETLKLLDAPGLIPGSLAKTLVWVVAVLGGILLIFKGLIRIDRERAAVTSAHSMPAHATNIASPLAIEITHGNTHISIHIQSEKNNAQ